MMLDVASSSDVRSRGELLPAGVLRPAAFAQSSVLVAALGLASTSGLLPQHLGRYADGSVSALVQDSLEGSRSDGYLLGVSYSPSSSASVFETMVGQSYGGSLESIEDRTPQVPALTTAQILSSALRDETGLTWQQISRLLGVTSRTLHHWASGAQISGLHLERLSKAFELLVKDVPAVDAAERRNLIFQPDGSGSCIFARAESQLDVKQPRRDGRDLSARDLLVAG